MNKKILKEVRNAYGDLNDLKVRNLNFQASEFVSRDEAFAILDEVVKSYNEFRPSLINYFHKDHKIKIAREGSVCLYVQGKDLPSQRELMADEYDTMEDGSTRIWWD